MGGFKRTLLGYRRAEVDAAFAQRGARITELEGELPKIGELQAALGQRDGELSELSTMVLERERDNRELREELRSAQDRHDRSLATLETLSERLEDVQVQARGQATRIRMKALSEAVEVSRRAQELAGRITAAPEQLAGNGNGASTSGEPGDGNGSAPTPFAGGKPVALDGGATSEFFEGEVKVDIGPLGDFSQLVGFEDAAAQIRATSQISVESFSNGRATLAIRLDEPVALLRELEDRCTVDFEVRHTAADHVVLDVDADASAARNAA